MPRTNFYESSRAVFPRAWCKRTSYAFFQTRNIGLQRSPFSYFWAVGASDLPGSSLGPAITSGSDRIRIISFSMFPRLVSTAQQSRWIADKRNWTLDEGNHYGRTVYSGLAAFLLIAQPRIRTNADADRIDSSTVANRYALKASESTTAVQHLLRPSFVTCH